MGKKNFRQVGRRTGRPEKRETKISYERTMPSIPSRYQYTKSNMRVEKKAFGTSSSRFHSAESFSLPGPGQYKSKSSLESKSNVSYSKYGYGGGFASKSKRFPQQTLSGGEGGKHVRKEAEERTSSSTNKKYPDTSFNCSARRFHHSSESVQMPGPGAYFKSSINRKKRATPTSSFRSSSSRGVDTKRAAKTPAPGQYEVKTLQRYNSKRPSSMFQSSTERLKSVSSSHLLPGPGTYDGYVESFVPKKAQAPKKKRPMKLAAAHFHKHEISQSKPPSKSIVSSVKNSTSVSVASKTKRSTMTTTTTTAVIKSSDKKQRTKKTKNMTCKSKPPGPCYYKVKLSTIGKSSFHRNKGGKLWV
jgi:hypothetical protein